jgi:hypothetical protein
MSQHMCILYIKDVSHLTQYDKNDKKIEINQSLFKSLSSSSLDCFPNLGKILNELFGSSCWLLTFWGAFIFWFFVPFFASTKTYFATSYFYDSDY